MEDTLFDISTREYARHAASAGLPVYLVEIQSVQTVTVEQGRPKDISEKQGREGAVGFLDKLNSKRRTVTLYNMKVTKHTPNPISGDATVEYMVRAPLFCFLRTATRSRNTVPTKAISNTLYCSWQSGFRIFLPSTN